ncbi:MAG: macrolide export ATP-binding/permease [uncultured bacterium]|nr:MAG: macrolide export ATP-binding/permease [uncultured bacterium]
MKFMKRKIVLKARNLRKAYKMSKKNIVNALRGVSIDVLEGDFTAIVGPSGCGKTTFLHLLGLLDRPDSGRLEIDGLDARKITERRAHKIRARKIGFIFQGFNLLPTLTAMENVMLSGKYGALNLKTRERRTIKLLKQVGLGDRMFHKPNELSGGQQQRVAVARALINSPRIILADEPTGELDSKTSLEIINMLKKLNKEQNQTFLIVTHNDEVAEACKKIVHLKDGRNAA